MRTGAVFTSETPTVQSVEVTPNESTISSGLGLQLQANVKTIGFANKAVLWEVAKGEGVTVDNNGYVKIPKDFDNSGDAPQVEIKATSIYDNSVSGSATITVL